MLSPEVQQFALQTPLSAGYSSKPGAVEVGCSSPARSGCCKSQIVALYEHYSDDAKRTQNDAAVNAEWVDWFGEVVCDVERLVHLTGPETLDSAGASSLFFILATQLFSESPTPLQTLKRLVHDFSKYATSLAWRIVPQSGLLEEMSLNSCTIRPGVSAVWLNGAPVPPGEPSSTQGKQPYALLDGDATGGVFDSSNRADGGNLIFWWNERSSAFILSQHVQRRLPFRLISTGKPSLHCLHFIMNTVSTLIDRSYSIRLGIISIVD
ncbi:hypothetical protein EDB86DRAFT_3107829 [Lactarius hatsudake]|nr:hypothetical protein EDB86DRAFT_3107829 [Lactarius hatsudake]